MTYHVFPIPFYHDNYAWILHFPLKNQAIIIDPGDATPIMSWLTMQKATPIAILITHHHADHTSGIPTLAETYKPCIFGPAGSHIQGLTHQVHEGDILSFPPPFPTFKVLELHGHTLDHLGFLGDDMLFCGDTLFSAGCGRLFEGTAAIMFTSLAKIKALPDHTKIFPAHEYTKENLIFANRIEPHNSWIKKKIIRVEKLLANGIPTLPSTIREEKKINPFLRTHVPQIINFAKNENNLLIQDEVDVFQAIRAAKDCFKN